MADDGAVPPRRPLARTVQWAAAALVALAALAGLRLAVDDLGTGANDPEHLAAAFAGLALFAIGAAGLVAVALWSQRRTRTSMTELLSTRRWSTGRRVRRHLDGRGVEVPPTYLYGGVPDLRALVARLNAEVRAQTDDLGTPNTDLEYFARVRDSLLETAGRDRARVVGARASWLLVLSALATVLGMGLHVWAVNRDAALGEARRSVVEPAAVEAAPPTTSPTRPSIVLVSPEAAGEALRIEQDADGELTAVWLPAPDGDDEDRATTSTTTRRRP